METKIEDIVKVGVTTIVVKDGKILLGKRRTDHGNNLWNTPGGKYEKHETLEECARREALEEAGITLHDVEEIGFTDDDFGYDHWITIFMTATTQDEPKNLEPEKCAGWEWFSPEELPKEQFLPIMNFQKKYPGALRRIANG